MKVKVIYFAAMREQAKMNEEWVETTAVNADELFDQLNETHGFSLDKSHLKVAINEDYSEFQTELKEMDTIVFIPPVAGG
ncbi:hypothetical protein A9Q84_12520 [Halobacteriovorax marinus]|uniref:Molybdopterin synthase sulfur carrier subunit n=1 Tax=Halobacteriovorax marinus TaxID=97084 RepID=A0A1Y5F8N1_9BACT|nr:hypothetical protein A9Q84_12520 [Halobacteriovorax marinus]